VKHAYIAYLETYCKYLSYNNILFVRSIVYLDFIIWHVQLEQAADTLQARRAPVQGAVIFDPVFWNYRALGVLSIVVHCCLILARKAKHLYFLSLNQGQYRRLN